jgi:hypothetical protein
LNEDRKHSIDAQTRNDDLSDGGQGEFRDIDELARQVPDRDDRRAVIPLKP